MEGAYIQNTELGKVTVSDGPGVHNVHVMEDVLYHTLAALLGVLESERIEVSRLHPAVANDVRDVLTYAADKGYVELYQPLERVDELA